LSKKARRLTSGFFLVDQKEKRGKIYFWAKKRWHPVTRPWSTLQKFFYTVPIKTKTMMKL